MNRGKTVFSQLMSLLPDYEFNKHLTRCNADFRLKAIQEWMLRAHEAATEHFEIACDTLVNHINGILAFFNDRSTNTHAKPFNAQITLFRADLRGVKDPKIFLYRLQKVIA